MVTIAFGNSLSEKKMKWKQLRWTIVWAAVWWVLLLLLQRKLAQKWSDIERWEVFDGNGMLLVKSDGWMWKWQSKAILQVFTHTHCMHGLSIWWEHREEIENGNKKIELNGSFFSAELVTCTFPTQIRILAILILQLRFLFSFFDFWFLKKFSVNWHLIYLGLKIFEN